MEICICIFHELEVTKKETMCRLILELKNTGVSSVSVYMPIVIRNVNDSPQSFQSIKTETIAPAFLVFTNIVVFTVEFPKSQSFMVFIFIKWV